MPSCLRVLDAGPFSIRGDRLDPQFESEPWQVSIEAGQQVLHYRLIEKIGEGGMGVVWKAEDTRLHRHVALKFVPEKSAQDTEIVERHLREARAASALNHPNICSIYDIGEWKGRRFIVMELLEGRSLERHIGSQPMEVEAAVELAIQISDALAAAHAKGIIHRDIKPANIFVVGDGSAAHRAKMLDFGLAKLAAGPAFEPGDDDATQTALAMTTPGTVMGTVSYMSPEQALGKELDHRTDVFSLGVVLYEMVTGRRAFEGGTSAAVFDAILNRPPTAPVELNSRVPAKLERILNKALEKDKTLRYQSAVELHADLKHLQRDSVTGEYLRPPVVEIEGRRAVVVLPFKMLSGGDEYEFLSLALAEAVSHDLSSIRELVLRPTSAVMRYAGQAFDPMQVAQELKAAVVVEGSIQRLGSNVRVQVQAWDAPGGSTIFSVKLDGTLDDLFGLQDQVAETLSGGLGVGSGEPAEEPPTANPRAYEQYLRASEHLLHWTAGDTSRAVDLLRSAVALDPGFSNGWARLSGALVGMGALYDPGPAWFEEAEQAIERALALDPSNPDAWTARGRMLWSAHHGFQNAEALRDLTKACGHPSHPYDAPLWRSVVLTHLGLHEEALAIVNEAMAIQSDDLMAMIVKGETLGWMGDTESFLDYMERGIKLDPASAFGHLLHPIPLVYLDKLEEAEDAIRSAKGILGEDALLLALEGLIWAKRGERERATSVLEVAFGERKSVSHLHHTHHYAAAAYSTLGDGPRAAKELKMATQTGMPNFPAFSIDPHFDSIREEADFKEMMGQLESSWQMLRQEFGSHSRP